MSLMKVKEVDSQFLTIITASLHRSTHKPQHAKVRGTGPHDTNEVLLPRRLRPNVGIIQSGLSY